MIETNPYEPSSSVGDTDRNDTVKPSIRPLRDAVLLSGLTFAAAPTLWVVIWFFAFYLSDTGPNDGGLTTFEKWDTLRGLLPFTLTISFFVAPIVFAFKLMKDWSRW